MLIQIMGPRVRTNHIPDIVAEARNITAAEEIRLVSQPDELPVILYIPTMEHFYCLEGKWDIREVKLPQEEVATAS